MTPRLRLKLFMLKELKIPLTCLAGHLSRCVNRRATRALLHKEGLK
jgi:hypothetical protein